MNRINTYLKNYRLKAVLAPLFKCLEAIFELLVPLAVASMIDIGIADRDVAYILKMGAVLLLLAFVGIASSLTAQWFAARTASIAATGLRHDLLKHILSLGYMDIDKYGTEKFMTAMTSDINQVQNGINMFLRLFMRSPFVVFGAAVMAYRIDKRMGGIFAVVIIVLSLIVFGILLGTVPFYKRVQRYKDDITVLTKEQITGAGFIRAFNQQENSKKEFEKSNSLLTGMQIFAGRISAFMNPVTVLILNFAIVLLIWNGKIYIDAGSLTKGSLIALINYMGQILTELIKFANLIILISKAIASDKRIEEVFSYSRTAAEGQVSICRDEDTLINRDEDILINMEGCSFIYPSASENSLSDIELKLEKGKHIGIIGGTGSGKSTLAKLMAGLYAPTAGKIIYSDNEATKSPAVKSPAIESPETKSPAVESPAVKDLCTIVPQKAVMLEGTILDNLTMGKKIDEKLLKGALRISCAEEFVNGFEDGIMHHIEQAGRNLSGGQRQRLGIARGICMKTPVLILDDPASALDFATERKLRRELMLYADREDITLVVVSQRAAMVRNLDKIVVLNDGRIEAAGTHEELYQNNELYREICISQQKEEESL